MWRKYSLNFCFSTNHLQGKVNPKVKNKGCIIWERTLLTSANWELKHSNLSEKICYLIEYLRFQYDRH